MKKLLILLIPVVAFGYSQFIDNPGDVIQSHWFDYNYLADDYYPTGNVEVIGFNLQFIWRHGNPSFCNMIVDLYEDSMGIPPIDSVEYEPTFYDSGMDYDGEHIFVLELDTSGQNFDLKANTQYWFAFTLWYSPLDPHPDGWPECLEINHSNWQIARYNQNGVWRWLYSDLCIEIATTPTPIFNTGIESKSLGEIKTIWR